MIMQKSTGKFKWQTNALKQAKMLSSAEKGLSIMGR